MSASRPQGRDAGFTVLEAVFAFAIIAGVALGAIELMRTASASIAAAHSRSDVAEAARSVLERIGSDIPADPGTTEHILSGVVVRLTIGELRVEESLSESDSNRLFRADAFGSDESWRRRTPLLQAVASARSSTSGRTAILRRVVFPKGRRS